MKKRIALEPKDEEGVSAANLEFDRDEMARINLWTKAQRARDLDEVVPVAEAAFQPGDGGCGWSSSEVRAALEDVALEVEARLFRRIAKVVASTIPANPVEKGVIDRVYAKGYTTAICFLYVSLLEAAAAKRAEIAQRAERAAEAYRRSEIRRRRATRRARA